MRTQSFFRTGLAFVFASAALAVPAWGCASQQKPRPVALDPSNPSAPESSPLTVAALSPNSGAPPIAVEQPTQAPATETPFVPPAVEGHGHDHPGKASPQGNAEAGEGGKTGKTGKTDKPGKTDKTDKTDKAGSQQATIYTCPMHPEVISDKPGRCPKCGMKLVPKEPAEGKK